MYKVIIAPKAQKQLRKIANLYKKAISQMIDELIEDPFLGKPLTRDLTKRYSYRIRAYRVIYMINQKDNIVNIISAGHRSVVYN